jgi:hypothetical protein
MTTWDSAKWLMWIALYLIPTIFLPWALSRSWVHQHGAALQIGPQQLFKRGELGLFGLVLATSAIWNLLQSQFMLQTRAFGAVILALSGIMSLSVWVEGYCRQNTGTDFHPARAWRDSRALALLVFSMVGVMEILLDRLAKVTYQ